MRVIKVLVLALAIVSFVGGCFPFYMPCEPYPMGLNCLVD